MTSLVELLTCDGFAIDSPRGCIGWVEETWLDHAGHPAALAIRMCDGRRALLSLDAVRAVDGDAQEVLVAEDPLLHELEPPRLLDRAGVEASWRATDQLVQPATVVETDVPTAPAVVAARVRTAPHGRPAWVAIAIAFACLALLVAVEIGLAFGIAYLVTGRAT
jgi:hypothetical protein